MAVSDAGVRTTQSFLDAAVAGTKMGKYCKSFV
jgi:hypothetical protein